MTLANRPLGEIIQPARLQRANSTNFPVLSMTMRNGLIDQADKFKKRIASADTSQYKVVRRNQLVVGFPIDEGVLAFQRRYDAAIVSPAYDVWDLKEPISVDCDFLERFLRSPIALRYYAAKLRGTTARRRTLPDDLFLSLNVPLPTLTEQRRIAGILDEAEALRTKRRVALAKIEVLPQAIFLELFGDSVTNPKDWPKIHFGQMLAIPLRNGLSPSKGGKVKSKVLTLSAITGRGFQEAAQKLSTFQVTPPPEQTVDDRDFLICRGSGNIKLVGRGFFPTRALNEVAFPDTMIAARIASHKVDRIFFEILWNSHAVRIQIESSARTTNGTYKVNQRTLERLSLISPPAKLQCEFARRVAAVEKLKAAQRASLEKLDALFASLQHRAFRGEL